MNNKGRQKESQYHIIDFCMRFHIEKKVILNFLDSHNNKGKH
jgi:hypothetical protein